MRCLSKLVLAGIVCTASAVAAADMKKAERNWKGKCASCHGADGKAQTEQGKKLKLQDLTSASFQKAKTDAQIKEVIDNGTKVGDAEMEGYKDKLDAAQIDDLTAYVRSLGKSSKAAKKKAKH
jgi:mono/diheme cytochrome c family protein